MSECVVRMENPDDCLKCGVRHICNPYVDYWQQDTRKKPKPGQKGCRIICSLPEGHGRLIDASAIIGEVDAGYTDDYGNPIPVNRPISVDEYLGLEVPTIVPAEAERSET